MRKGAIAAPFLLLAIIHKQSVESLVEQYLLMHGLSLLAAALMIAGCPVLAADVAVARQLERA